MAIGQVVTGGLGNGTLVTTIPLVLFRGLKPEAGVSDLQITYEKFKSASIREGLRQATVVEQLRSADVREC